MKQNVYDNDIFSKEYDQMRNEKKGISANDISVKSIVISWKLTSLLENFSWRSFIILNRLLL